MDIPRYRIGNDLTVLWAICNNDGTPFDLSGKVVRLFVTNDKGITEVKPTITSDKDGSANNVILWNYLGDDQKVLGKHTLTVEILTSDDKRKIKRDVCDAFTLVSRSESEETGGDANFMDSGSIYLSTKLDVYRFGNVRVEIGTNGNWFIDGYDTGKTALGGGPGLVNIIYKESDLGGEFQPDSVIDTFNANAINAIYKALKAISLKDVSNISLANLAAYDVLTYNGSNWINLPFKDLINLFRGPSESGSDTPVSGDSYWILGKDGKLYSNYDIYVRGNAVIEGDTSSGGSGQDTPAAGGSLSNLSDVSLSSLSEGDVLVYDKGNNVWYNVPQSKIMPNLEGYAKESDLDALQAEVDNIDAVLGLSETAEGYINTWAEVVAFLDAIEQEKDLASILATMNTNIGKNATDIESLTTRVEAEEDVTETYKTWWADLKKYIKVENGNVKIDTNLIITGDTSSGGSGQDTPASGTVTGIKVSASETLTPNNAGIIDMVSVLSSIDVSDQLTAYAKTEDVNAALLTKQDTISDLATIRSGAALGATALQSISKNMVDSVLGSTAAGNANRFLMSTGSTSVWAAISKTMVTDALGYTPLSTGGGTISGRLIIGDYIQFTRLADSKTYLLGQPYADDATKLSFYDGSAWRVMLHSGNYSNYALKIEQVAQSQTDNSWIQEYALKNRKSFVYNSNGDEWAYLIGLNDTSEVGAILRMGYASATLQVKTVVNGTWSGWKSVAFLTSTVANAEKVAGIGVSTGLNKPWGTIPAITNGGYMDVGRHFEFHYDNTTGSDFSTILQCTGNYSNMVSLPSASGTLALLTDNVASATKLQTARTIWGQSFDGTGNVDGLLTIGYGSTTNSISNSIGLHLNRTGASSIASAGIALTNEGVGALLLGGNGGCLDIYTYNGTTASKRMLINSSGNVTIGGSDLAGTNWKMYVNGKAIYRDAILADRYNGQGNTAGASIVINKGDDYFGMGPSARNVSNLSFGLTSDTSGTWKSELLTIAQNGNVLIGTTTDSGYKLDVVGTAKVNGLRTSAISIECDASGNTSGYGGEINRFGGGQLWIQAREGGLQLGNAASTTNFNGAVTMSSTLSVSGNVGIGTASPSTKLDVNGTIATNQYIRINAWTGYGSGFCDMWYDGGITTLEIRSSVKITKDLIVAGDTSSGSDIRFKDIIKNKTIKIADIAKAPLFTFKWNDREDDSVHLGSSAQYWEKVTPWLVKGEDFKSLDYSTLGVAMGISLAKKAVNHEERIKALEAEIKRLKEEMIHG